MLARVRAIVSFVLIVSSNAAIAQDSPLYVNRDDRFAVIFPGQPTMREVTHTTRSGASVPAREFFVEENGNRFAVTVVEFTTGRREDPRSVEHAAEQLRQRGEVRFQAAANYDLGIPGRQLNIFEANDRQLRASIYMYDRRLYITEASAAVGDLAAIQFEQSIMLLDADGNDADRGVVAGMLAVIGRVFGL